MVTHTTQEQLKKYRDDHYCAPTTDNDEFNLFVCQWMYGKVPLEPAPWRQPEYASIIQHMDTHDKLMILETILDNIEELTRIYFTKPRTKDMAKFPPLVDAINDYWIIVHGHLETPPKTPTFELNIKTKRNRKKNVIKVMSWTEHAKSLKDGLRNMCTQVNNDRGIISHDFVEQDFICPRGHIVNTQNYYQQLPKHCDTLPIKSMRIAI
jgi:hypothetical protein